MTDHVRLPLYEFKKLLDAFEENANLKEKLKYAERCGELSEFLLFIRKAISKFEIHYCIDFPPKDQYLTQIGNHRPIFSSQLRDDLHFRRWLWILVAGDEDECFSIKYLRKAFNYEIKNYLWFAKQMEVFHSVLSDDIPFTFPLDMCVQHMKREKFLEYVKFFKGDLRAAVRLFVLSRYNI